MYKISHNIQESNDKIDKQIIHQRQYKYNQQNNIPNDYETINQQDIKNQITHQIQSHYENNYHNNYNNNIQYGQQQELINDVTKMHLLPPHCPMNPHSYTDFYNDSAKLFGVSPYHLHVEPHKKDDKPKIKLQYNNFYSDFKTDALKYNSPVMAEYNNKQNSHNSNNNQNSHSKPHIKNKNIEIYKETKNQKGFAIPMKSNGSNTLETMFNDCLNKPTFEYKRFGYDMLTRKNNSNPNPDFITNTNHLVDNPLYNIDISEETEILYSDYMNDREQNALNIYSADFEDMYIMGYNPGEDNDIDKPIKV